MSTPPKTPDTVSEKLGRYWLLAAIIFVWFVIGGVYGIIANIESNAPLWVKFLGVAMCGVTALSGLHLSVLALLAPFSTWAAERIEKVFPPDEKPPVAPHPSPDPSAARELAKAKALRKRGVRLGLIGVTGVLLCSVGANGGGVLLALCFVGGLLSLALALIGTGIYWVARRREEYCTPRGWTFRQGAPKPACLPTVETKAIG